MNFDFNEIKLSFEKPRYETNGNKVKCTLNYTINVPTAELDEPVMTMNGYNPEAKTIGLSFDLGVRHTAVGSAICSPDDEFNKKTGREIAEARAEAKAYKHAAKLVKKYVTAVINQYVEITLGFEAKSDYVQRHNKEYIAEIGG